MIGGQTVDKGKTGHKTKDIQSKKSKQKFLEIRNFDDSKFAFQSHAVIKSPPTQSVLARAKYILWDATRAILLRFLFNFLYALMLKVLQIVSKSTLFLLSRLPRTPTSNGQLKTV